MRAPSPRDAAVTGIGAVTSLAFGAKAAFEALLEGRTAIRRVEGNEAPDGARWAAPVEPPLLRAQVPEVVAGQIKFLNASGELAATAAAEAAETGGLAGSGVPAARRGLYLAQGDLDRVNMVDFRPAVVHATEGLARPLDFEAMNRATLHVVNPLYLLETLLNNSFSAIASWHDLKGSNTSMSGYATPGLTAISLGARAVARGEAELVLAVGASRLAAGVPRFEVRAMGGGLPEGSAYRPLDRRRAGWAPGEASGALLLEPLAAARARGAAVRAVVLGLGAATGPIAGSMGASAGALRSAAGAALAEAGASAGDLLAVVLPGLGTGVADRAALEAAREVLRGAPVPVASWKGATGFCGAGSEAAEAAFSILALETGTVPGTVGFGVPESGFEEMRISADPQRGDGRAVLLLACGLDGQAVAIVLARAE